MTGYIAEISWEMIRIHSYIPSTALGKLFFQLRKDMSERESAFFEHLSLLSAEYDAWK